MHIGVDLPIFLFIKMQGVFVYIVEGLHDVDDSV